MLEALAEYDFWCDHDNFGKIKGDYACSSSSLINENSGKEAPIICQQLPNGIDNSNDSIYNGDGKGGTVYAVMGRVSG